MIRVVVVDDDFRVAGVHAAYVGQVPGFDVVGIAHTARTAIEVAANSAADLILLDQYLPDGLGTSVVRRVSCDVIMLTAASESRVVWEAVRSGAVNYLIKPFTEADLAARLHAYARFRSLMTPDRPLEQSDVDRAFRALHEGDCLEGTLRKGRSSHTAQLIVDTVRASPDPVTAIDVADRVGISRGTAQRYLSDLAAQGRVSVALRYGVSGRPEHLYGVDAPRIGRSPRR